jgi:hypothetical protein
MPRIIRPPKYTYFPHKPQPESSPSAPAGDPMIVIGDIIQDIITKSPGILYADIREKMVAAGFHKKVIGQIWNDRFFRSRAHLEPPKRKKQVVVEVSR